MTVDLKKLLASRQNTAVVEIPGVGEVTVRGLTRHEVTLLQKVREEDASRLDSYMVSLGMVDPKVSEDDVDAWMKVATLGEFVAVLAKINELSGFGDGADKS